jgi:enolase 1/2/3
LNIRIQSVRAMEILDSRGSPTLRASRTGKWDVCHRFGSLRCIYRGERGGGTRDGDSDRYGGKGVRHAVDNVNNIIAPALLGMDPRHQAEIDRTMIDLDGTPNKAKIIAGLILAVPLVLLILPAVYLSLQRLRARLLYAYE